jgi:hypothetical protein
MGSKKTFQIILYLFLAAIIWLNVEYHMGILSLLYIIPVLFATIMESEKHILWSTVLSLLAIIVGICIPGYDNRFSTLFRQIVDYDSLFNILSFVMVGTVSLISVKQKQKEIELNQLNEDLEMRVLVRTAASEYRAQKLEQQIVALQLIKQAHVDINIAKLDEVISELKDISKNEKDINKSEKVEVYHAKYK